MRYPDLYFFFMCFFGGLYQGYRNHCEIEVYTCFFSLVTSDPSFPDLAKFH